MGDERSTGQGAKARRPSWWNRPVWWANILLALITLLVYASIHIRPSSFWPAALLGMGYPFLLPLHLLAILWWLVFRRKRALLSIAVLLIGWSHLGDFVQLLGRKSNAEVRSEALTVMSYNVRLFDLYNWSHNKRTRNEIFDLIRAEDADILCLQEFYRSDDKRFFATRDTLLEAFRYTGCHDEYTQHTRKGHHFGIATFTTLPILAKGAINFPDELNNLCIWTDVKVKNDTIRVYNAHLASLRFGDADYRFMKALDTDTRRDSLKSGGTRILKRLRDAFIRRADEVDQIVAHMASSPHPVLFCGDINDTPMSYSYHTLCNAGLEDAFVQSGRGVGHTYIGAFPSFRIDHILASDALKCYDFRTLPDELSDHRPIACRVLPVAGE